MLESGFQPQRFWTTPLICPKCPKPQATLRGVFLKLSPDGSFSSVLVETVSALHRFVLGGFGQIGVWTLLSDPCPKLKLPPTEGFSKKAQGGFGHWEARIHGGFDRKNLLGATSFRSRLSHDRLLHEAGHHPPRRLPSTSRSFHSPELLAPGAPPAWR